MKQNLVLSFILLFFTHSAVYAKSNYEKWNLVENDYFRIYSDVKPEKVMVLLEELERLRVLLEVGLVVAVPQDAPKSIVVLFKSKRQFRKYVHHRNVAGYVVAVENVPVIVMPMSSRGLDRQQVIKHEYVHVVQAYDPQPKPKWYLEGLAEFFSTVTYHGDFAVAGLPVEERWNNTYYEYDYDKLIENEFDHLKSRYGKDAYSQYWLLTNYSLTHDDGAYQTNLSNYLALYANGDDSLEAFKKAYKKTPNEFAKEALKNYRNRSYSYNKLVFKLDKEKMDLNASVEKADESVVERLLLRLKSRLD